MGAKLRGAGGMLVGAKGFSVARPALEGEAVEITARCAHELGLLQLHEVAARSVDMDVELARGELKVATEGGAP
jgi:hypothetical protein